MQVEKSVEELTQWLYLRDGLTESMYFFVLFYVSDLCDVNALFR